MGLETRDRKKKSIFCLQVCDVPQSFSVYNFNFSPSGSRIFILWVGCEFACSSVDIFLLRNNINLKFRFFFFFFLPWAKIVSVSYPEFLKDRMFLWQLCLCEQPLSKQNCFCATSVWAKGQELRHPQPAKNVRNLRKGKRLIVLINIFVTARVCSQAAAHVSLSMCAWVCP